MSNQPGRGRILLLILWVVAVLAPSVVGGLWYCLSPPETFVDRCKRAARATTEAEVQAIFQGYPCGAKDEESDETISGTRLSRHAVRYLEVHEKREGGEGIHIAEFYFDDAGRLIYATWWAPYD